jgi:hypothetical protein
MAEPPQTDPFMKVVKGQFPLSENSGAARYWAAEDGVPRPDRTCNLLLILSIVGGVIGADHFYLRSPKTGFMKMLTFGGFGLWWLWDVAQILFEKTRVVNYGMTGLLDITTGIGQGMITDKGTRYTTKSSYSMWSWSTIFGLFGFDSFFVLKNNGQGARKLMEGMITLGSLGSLLSIGLVGLPSGFFAKIGALIGAGIAVMGLFFFGTMVGVSWYKTLMKSLDAPEKLFKEGLVFNDKDDKQLNSLVNWLVGNLDTTDERKKQIISDIKYGSIPPEKMREMFKVFHESEIKPDTPSDNSDIDNPGSMPSFLAYMAAPASIFWYWTRLTAKGIALAFFPAGAAIEKAANIAVDVLDDAVHDPNMKDMFAGSAAGLVPGIAGKALTAVISGKGVAAMAQGAVQDVVGQAQGAVAGAVQGAVQDVVGQAQGAVAGAVQGAVQDAVGQAQGAVNVVTNLGQAAAGARNAAAKETEQMAAAAAQSHARLKGLSDARRAAAAAAATPQAASTAPNQRGAGRPEPLSLESKVMGAAAAALIGGGALKFLIDNLMAE